MEWVEVGVAAVGFLILLAGVIASYRYTYVTPALNEILVIASGCGDLCYGDDGLRQRLPYRIVAGGSLINPLTERAQRLSVAPISVEVEVAGRRWATTITASRDSESLSKYVAFILTYGETELQHRVAAYLTQIAWLKSETLVDDAAGSKLTVLNDEMSALLLSAGCTMTAIYKIDAMNAVELAANA